MNEIQLFTNNEITRHNFDKYKEDLKRFSEKQNNDFYIPRVETSSLFVFNHNVTGKELNNVTRTIGEHLIELNKSQTDLIKEFRVIYDAFESLDKEYISGILTSLHAAQLAFNENIHTVDELKKTQVKLEKAQKDIQSTIDVQKRIINGLSDFNKKLNKNKHLDNIDEMWEDTQRLSINLDNLKTKVNKFEKRKNELFDKIEELEQIINYKNNENKKIIENIVYSIEKLQKDIKVVEENQKLFDNNIGDLQKKIEKNGHFNDIDVMWENTQYMMNTINELSNKLNNLEQEKDSLLLKNEELVNLIKNKKDESKKIQNLSIATAILFVVVVVNFAVNYLR